MAQPEPNSTFAFVIEGFGLTFISIIGFIGNIYAIRLIQKRFKVSLIDEIFLSPAAIQKLTDKSRHIRDLLICLSVFDMIFLVASTYCIGIPALIGKYTSTICLHMMPYWFAIGGIGRVGSVILTLCVTLERYVSVCQPFSKLKFKKFLMPASLAFAIAYNLPKFFEWEVVYVSNSTTSNNLTISASTNLTSTSSIRENISLAEEVGDKNKNLSSIFENIFPDCFGEEEKGNITDETISLLHPHLKPSELRLNWYYLNFYFFGSKLILIELIPYFAMIWMNYKIWKQIQTLIKHPTETLNRENDDAKLFREEELQEEEINLARTLIIVVLVFIFCQSVKLIPDLYEVFYCSIEPECDSLLWIEAIIDVSHLLLAINSSCNVVIYTFSRKQFQENISDLIQRRFPINEKRIENNLEMTPLGSRLKKIKNVETLKGGSSMTNGGQSKITIPTQNVTTQLGLKSAIDEMTELSDHRHSSIKFETEAVLKVDKSNQWPNNMYYTIEEHMAHRV